MQDTTFTKDDIVGREYISGTYCRSDRSTDDLVVVKENIHLKDQRVIPNICFIKNFKRKFWITKEGFRNHKEKKEWEDISRLKEYTSTEALLPDAVARAMDRPGIKTTMRQLARNPYLYGTDIPTTSLIKDIYKKKYPDCLSPKASLAVLDIETDVVHGHEDIICITLSFKDRIILAVNEWFLQGITDTDSKIQTAFTKYLGKFQTERNITLEVVTGKSSGEIIKAVFQRAHEWKPDFIGIFNMIFDMPRIEKALQAEYIDIKDVISDPAVPAEFRHYKFKEGQGKKTTSSGRVTLLAPYDRWHTISCPASFAFVDVMCLYRNIRLAEGLLPGGYSLDNILHTHKLDGKLKFEGVEADDNLSWHKLMQSQHKIEYLIYNLYDCISIELLDDLTGDISMSYPSQAGLSDFSRFHSNPTKIVDDLHFFCLENGKVIATFPGSVEDANNNLVVDRKGWIVTLPSHQVDDTGLNVIRELPAVQSMVRKHVADLDIAGTYPNVQMVLNMSRETTHREFSAFQHLNKEQQMAVGLNLSAGTNNAMEIAMAVLKLPTPDEMLAAFVAETI